MLVTSLLGVAAALGVVISPASAVCNDPKVRKEWRTLTTSERTQWVDAVKCLNQLPHDPSYVVAVGNGSVPLNTSGSFYDDIVYMHVDLVNVIHQTGRFLPWHRYYTYIFNKALTDKCGYEGPETYWNWSLDSQNVENSTVFDPDPVSGLGTWGLAENDYQIQDGAFGANSTFRVSYPIPHVVRRNYTLQAYAGDLGPFQQFVTDPDLQGNATFTPDIIRSLTSGSKGNFTSFQLGIDGFQGMHGAVHLTFGGDLQGTCPEGSFAGCFADLSWSPNDPMFFLHHGMIDKLWYDWQHYDPANRYAFHGGSVRNIDNETIVEAYPNGLPPWLTFQSSLSGEGFYADVAIGDVIDTQEGILCYTYDS